jgi:DNA-directed RNA polymerase subunit beta
VHPSHYGRICPIETPEGPNIGLIASLWRPLPRQRLRLHRNALPQGRERPGHRTDRLPHRRPEEGKVIAQANAEIDDKGHFVERVTCRQGATSSTSSPSRRSTTWTSRRSSSFRLPRRLIPFLEHDDANRALMGSNMQRQAVPLLVTEAPFRGHRH